MKKMGLFVRFPYLRPDLWYFKLSKKVHFLKAIYIHATERSYCTLSKNGIAYYAMTYLFGDVRV